MYDRNITINSSSLEGVFAVVEKRDGYRPEVHYVLKDNLGSWTTITYAWGNRRNASTWNGSATDTPLFDRGYTLHEHYDDFGLINMNGRLYDPLVGRMLSPDIVIQDEQNSQAYNRYSYCFNNPIKFIDPTGMKIKPFNKEEQEAYEAFRKRVFDGGKKYENVKKELIRLEEADEVFCIRMGENITNGNGGGNFIYNKETDQFDVNISSNGDFNTMEKMAHELKHADQYMDRKLGFDLQTGKMLAYDINDEIEAFERQGIFGKTLSEDEIRNHSIYKRLPDMKSNLTIDKLQNMRPSYPFDEMKRINKLYQEHNKVNFLYHDWKKDIK